jgi:hypothetical protein
MPFSQGRSGDLHEASFGAQRRYVFTAEVTHAGAQTTNELMDVKG